MRAIELLDRVQEVSPTFIIFILAAIQASGRESELAYNAFHIFLFQKAIEVFNHLREFIAPFRQIPFHLMCFSVIY